ncbi:MAG: hypothetical protein UR94_C0018G0001, partial [Parcubacteria group bacterium GW2011_GWA2_36_10]
MSLSTQKLFIHNHLSSRQVSGLFLSEKTENGQLFLSIELAKEKLDQQIIANQIMRAVSEYFYQSQSQNAENTLEEILQKLNQLLPDLAPAKIKNWFSNLNLIVGITQNNAIYLAGVGSGNVYLFQQGKISQILDKNPKINPAKIFSDIISGQLEEGDALVVSSDALFDYIAKEKIRTITQKYSPEGTVKQIETLLATVPDFVSFNGIFVKYASTHDLEFNPPVKESPQTAIEALESQVLEDEPKPDIKSSPKAIKPGVKTKLVFDKSALQNVPTIRKITWFFTQAGDFFSKIAFIFKTIYLFLKKTYLFIFSKKFRREKEQELLNQGYQKLETKVKQFNSLRWQKKIAILGLSLVLNQGYQKLETKVKQFNSLRWQKKIAILGLSLVLLIFLQSLVFLTEKKSEQNKESSYRDTINQINNTLNEVEASLIYKDDKRAESLLLEVTDLLGKIQAKSDPQAEELALVKETTARLLNKVRRINYVPEPLELFDLSTLQNPKKIVQKNGQFYILDQANLYALQDKALSVLTPLANGDSLADWPNEDRLILHNADGYQVFNLKDKLKENFSFSQNTQNISIQDLAIYGNNMYVLDKQAKQIFKYPQSNNTFANGQAWLKANLDLSNASSLAVDGDLYTVLDNGQINKLNKGNIQKFDYHQPYPQIGAKAIIKTFAGAKYLYLIDPANQRVVIFDKAG